MTISIETTPADALSGLRRVCVLTDPYLTEWQSVALESMVEETGVEISLVVVNAPSERNGYDRDSAGRRSLDDPRGLGLHDVSLFIDILSSEGPWALVLAERKLSWMLGWAAPRWEKRHPVDHVECLAGVPRIRCQPIPDKGAWNRLPDEVVDQVVSESDAVIRFGFGLLKGRIIDEPEFGVLSFHPADIRQYRGLGPSRIFLNGDDTAGATLQRLSETIDGGEVILIDTVDVSDARTLDEVVARIDELQARMLPRGIARLRDPDFSPMVPARLGDYVPLSKRSALGFATRILAKNIAGRLYERFKR